MCQCSTNNCGCNDYTLPAGLTGPTGATGATGLTGPAGTNLIASIIVNQSTTTTGSYETLYTYTLSDPSPISTDGDILIIRSFWSTNDGTAVPVGSAKTVKVMLDSTDLTVYGITPTPNLGNGIFEVVYDIELTRITSTTVSPTAFIKHIAAYGLIPFGQGLHSPNINSAGALTIPSLDSGDIDVNFKAYSITAGDLTLDKIQIFKITA